MQQCIHLPSEPSTATSSSWPGGGKAARSAASHAACRTMKKPKTSRKKMLLQPRQEPQPTPQLRHAAALQGGARGDGLCHGFCIRSACCGKGTPTTLTPGAGACRAPSPLTAPPLALLPRLLPALHCTLHRTPHCPHCTAHMHDAQERAGRLRCGGTLSTILPSPSLTSTVTCCTDAGAAASTNGADCFTRAPA